MIKINVGEFWGNLEIIEKLPSTAHGDRVFLCRCVCGKEVIRKATVLRQVRDRGYKNSCGCKGIKKN